MITRILLNEYKQSDLLKLSPGDLKGLYRNQQYVRCLGTDKQNLYRVKAEQWVGDIRLPNIHLSIRPKMGNTDFLRMMFEGDGEASPKQVYSSVKKQHSFPDILAQNFLFELENLARDGIERKYIEHEENATFYRGQVDVFKDILSNTPVRSGIYCRYDELSPDTLYNQILDLSLQTLSLVSSREWSEKLHRAKGIFSNINHLNHFPDFDLPSKKHKYRRILYYSKLIQKALSQAPNSFGISGYGFLLDMNKVFEGFLRNRLRSELEPHRVHVFGKEEVNFCEHVKIDPDIRVGIGKKVLLIGDVKYKEDWNYSNPDVFQMHAYLEHYKSAKEAIIFYPSTKLNIVNNFITLPTNKVVRKVGIPRTKLFDKSTWESVTKIILPKL